MKCGKCGAEAKPGCTTSVTDFGGCVLIVRNVPCYKCTECNDIFYTGDVVQKLEKIIKRVQSAWEDIYVVDYGKVA